MNPLRKNVVMSGTFAALVLLSALTASPAANASGTSLVQAVQQAGAAVIVPSIVPSTKMVTLSAFINPGSLYSLHQVSASGDSTEPFVVPSGENFVITSVEITPLSNSPVPAPNYVYFQEEGPYVLYELWLVSNQVSTSFQYPTGFVLQAGSSPVVSAQLMCDIFVHGYLTAA
jgi:hypothetical protein